MYCNNPIEHTVRAGDTLYKLSKQYKTTVSSLIFTNPKVNPYNLQIGMTLMVCPGEEYAEPTPFWQMRGPQDMRMPGDMRPPSNMRMPDNMENPSNMRMPDNMRTPDNMGDSYGMKQMQNTLGTKQQEQAQKLRDLMRISWLEHSYLIRMFLVSVAGDIDDQQEIVEKLIENADEIANLFAKYYPQNVVRELRDLLMEHVELTGSYITMKRSGENGKEEELLKQMKENDEKLADLLSGETPEYDRTELLEMMDRHQQLFQQAAMERFAGDYKKDMDTFQELKKQALDIADYLSNGLTTEARRSGL